MSRTSRHTADRDDASLPCEMEERRGSAGVVQPPALTDMTLHSLSAHPLFTEGTGGLFAAGSHTSAPAESPAPGLLSPDSPAFPQLPTLSADPLPPTRTRAASPPASPRPRGEAQAASAGGAGERGRAVGAVQPPQPWQRLSDTSSAGRRRYREGPTDTSNRSPRAQSAGVPSSSSTTGASAGTAGAAAVAARDLGTFPPLSGRSASVDGGGGGGGGALPAAPGTTSHSGARPHTVQQPMAGHGDAPFLGSISAISDSASMTHAAAPSMLSGTDMPSASTTLAALPSSPKASMWRQHTGDAHASAAAPSRLMSFPEPRTSSLAAEPLLCDDNRQRTLSMNDTTTFSSAVAAAGRSSVTVVDSLTPHQLSPTPSARRQQLRFQEERRTSRSTMMSQSGNAAAGTAFGPTTPTTPTTPVPRAMDHIVVDNREFAILRVLPAPRSPPATRGASTDDDDAGSTAHSPNWRVETTMRNNNSSTTNNNNINNASTSRTQREVSRNAESADEIGWRGVADFASLASGLPPPTGDSMGGLALLQQVRIATAEERRVRLLFHNRPHVQLEKRPLVVTNAVLDRPSWEQPLCYLPLFVPCMRNAFYSVPLSTVLRTSWEADLPGPSQPSLAYSDATTSPPLAAAAPDASTAAVPRRDGGGPHAEAPARTLVAPAVGASTVYHVPITAPRPVLTRPAPPHPRERHESLLHRPAAAPPATGANPLRRTPAHPPDNHVDELVLLRDEVARHPLHLGHNLSHLLYRCFCVRCAIASQAQAMQADADMRAAHPTPFPCCGFLGVESKSYSDILCLLCVLDVLTLGVPCGCCCYHGLGTALYGWHLRYLLRARYRIFAWTSIDLLTMFCVPGLAVDQQGAELLLSGTPEATVRLQFMA